MLCPCWYPVKGVSLWALCLEPDQLANLRAEVKGSIDHTETESSHIGCDLLSCRPLVLCLTDTSPIQSGLRGVHHDPRLTLEMAVALITDWEQSPRWELWPPIEVQTEWLDRSFLPALPLYSLSIQEILKTFATILFVSKSCCKWRQSAPWKSSISIMPVWHRTAPARFLKQANRFQAKLLQGKESTVRSQSSQ